MFLQFILDHIFFYKPVILKWAGLPIGVQSTYFTPTLSTLGRFHIDYIVTQQCEKLSSFII